ncbi:putative nuclease HARBI1 [Thalassophryne amazonica]|uniref:putative nuclease HARBI1 n=1 Tax=Thalassophryne amazonica TaxID=390379 RepID=UPI0014716D90|nr:putative nuclease HARBI1 [Thalassophryne amazonica]
MRVLSPLLKAVILEHLDVLERLINYVAERERLKEQEERRRQAIARRRRMWVSPWLQHRRLHGQYEKLMKELHAEDVTAFTNFMHMEPPAFHELLTRIAPRITKQDTNCRKALEPGLKLAITLRFLATGNSYKSLQYGFRVAHNTISMFIPQVCQAIIEELSDEVLMCPDTPEGWKQVAQQFYNCWNFPHCVGAIDAKHVAIKKPLKAGSLFYNDKGFFSIVLLAIVDAHYKFMYVDIGRTGSGSDAGVFNESPFKSAIEAGHLNLPEADPLPHDDQPLGYFLVGDDAFALKTWLMKPLPLQNMTRQQQVYNYRLSRARRVVENAFGLLAARFRCLLVALPLTPDKVIKITHACCVLHNFLQLRNPTTDVATLDQEDPQHNHEIIPGSWRQDAQLPDMEHLYRGDTSRAAMEQRNYLIEYVNSPVGSVPWQDELLNIH